MHYIFATWYVKMIVHVQTNRHVNINSYGIVGVVCTFVDKDLLSALHAVSNFRFIMTAS